MSIEIVNVSKKFGDFSAVNEVSFKIPEGELVGLLGPSGSGKTTLLRLIAGLEVPDSGSILFHGTDMIEREVKSRGVGFVFQHYALFRHMTVFENVAFGMKVQPRALRPSKEFIKNKVTELLNMVKLDFMADRYPRQLSGGQRQRVALARALAVEPKILLLDEPFGALDAKVRKSLRRWLRRLHDEIGITSVFVTHDQEEALELADRVVVMNEGRIEQIASPEEIYSKPANSFVYKFIGDVTVLKARIENGALMLGHAQVVPDCPLPANTREALVYARPHFFDVAETQKTKNCFKATIKYVTIMGAIIRVDIITEWGDEVQIDIPHGRHGLLKLEKGTPIYISPQEDKLFTEIVTNDSDKHIETLSSLNFA